MASSDFPQLVRQWTLLQTLASRRYGLTIQEMADETGVSKRTIQRDLVKLRDLGFPLLEQSVSAHGRVHWCLENHAKSPSLNFTWDEAIALHLGQRHLDPLAGTLIWKSVNSAFRKIRACLGEQALRHLEKMRGAFHHTQFGASDYSDKSDVIDNLSLAVEEHWLAAMTYRSLNATEHVEYEIAPYGIVFHRHSLYLIALSNDHAEIRTFKIDRVEEVELTKLQFQLPPDFNLQDHLAPGFGIFHNDGPLKTIRVRFAPGSAARVVAEGRWHASQKLEPQPDGSLLAQFDLADLHEITSWILSFGAKATVLDPPELREEIMEELRRSLSQFERSVGWIEPREKQ